MFDVNMLRLRHHSDVLLVVVVPLTVVFLGALSSGLLGTVLVPRFGMISASTWVQENRASWHMVQEPTCTWVYSGYATSGGGGRLVCRVEIQPVGVQDAWQFQQSVLLLCRPWPWPASCQ